MSGSAIRVRAHKLPFYSQAWFFLALTAELDQYLTEHKHIPIIQHFRFARRDTFAVEQQPPVAVQIANRELAASEDNHLPSARYRFPGIKQRKISIKRYRGEAE